MSRSTAVSEQEVLLSFSAEPVHDKETLERYLRQFPYHAEALIDCSLQLEVEEADGKRTEMLVPSHVADRAWDVFQAAISKAAAGAANPFETLDQAAFKNCAKKLNVNTLFLSRLRDRIIIAASIPLAFTRKLAETLNISVEGMQAFLSAPQTLAGSESFSASEKPKVGGQMSFDEALKTSHLSAEQLAELKALVD